MRRATAPGLAPADRITRGGAASASDTLGILGHLLGPAAPALCHRDAPELLSLRDVVRDERLDFAVAALLAQVLLDCVDAPPALGRRVDDPRPAVDADAVERSLLSRPGFIAPELERLALGSPCGAGAERRGAGSPRLALDP